MNGIIASLLVLNSVQVLCEAPAAGTAICVNQIIITLPVLNRVPVLYEGDVAGTAICERNHSISPSTEQCSSSL